MKRIKIRSLAVLAIAVHVGWITSSLPAIAQGTLIFTEKSLIGSVFIATNVDLWRQTSSIPNRPLGSRFDQWAGASAKVRRGDGKTRSSMKFKEDHEKLYDFSSPTFAFKYPLFARTDSTEKASITNLLDKPIAAKKRVFSRPLIKSLHPSAEMVFAENSFEGFRKLLRYEVNGVVEDKRVEHTTLQQQSFRVMSPLSEGLASKIEQIAVVKGNLALQLQINEAPSALKGSDKWPASETVLIKKGALWALFTAASIVLILLALVAGILYLKNLRKSREQISLQVAKQEAERANQAKSRLLSYASHDLLQPLQHLSLLNAMLSKKLDDSSAQKELLAKQKEALSGMKTMLISLLESMKLESGSIDPCFSDVPLQRLFDKVATDFGAQAKAKGLNLQIEPTDAIAYTDPRLIAQVIQNLVANAIRYTDKGFVQLDCSREAGALRVKLTDTGIGIPKEQLSNIFTEFYQLESKSYSGRGGLGLGLAIVQSVADKLSSQIDVESEVGKGSTFSFMLPIGAVESIESTASTEMAIPCTLQTQTILLVDDDVDLLEALQALFEFEGYRVATATSSQETYVKCEEMTAVPDIIVTDLHLGQGESGIDIIRSVRTRAGVPAILVTGDGSVETHALVAENIEVMIKPVDPDQLFATIQKLLINSNAVVPRS